MDVLATIAVWGIGVGVILGLLAHINLSADIRAKVERHCIRSAAALPLVIGALVLNAGRPSMAAANIAIGLIAIIPAVVGVVLWLGNREADV